MWLTFILRTNNLWNLQAILFAFSYKLNKQITVKRYEYIRARNLDTPCVFWTEKIQINLDPFDYFMFRVAVFHKRSDQTSLLSSSCLSTQLFRECLVKLMLSQNQSTTIVWVCYKSYGAPCCFLISP